MSTTQPPDDQPTPASPDSGASRAGGDAVPFRSAYPGDDGLDGVRIAADRLYAQCAALDARLKAEHAAAATSPAEGDEQKGA